MPYKSSIPLSWRLKRALYRLVGTECRTCSTVYFPPRSVCPKCRRKGDIAEKQLSGNGEIYSYTIIHTAPAGFEHATPYAIAIVKTDENVLVTGQVVAPFNDIGIGKRVEMVFRKISEDGNSGIINYGFKFMLSQGKSGNQ